MPDPVKIQIATAADTSGATKATDALDDVVVKADEVADALKPTGAPSVIEDIPADAGPAAAALDEVTEAAAEVAAELGKPPGRGIKDIPKDAKPAVGSIRALEAEVERLQRELGGLRVGSAEFIVLADRAKVAKVALAAAEVEARRLGGTLRRRGDTNAAILEASRGLEDLQYGVRGVLNNIPGLVMALGGTGGLAGVLSMVAVGGSVLYTVLSKGSKASEKETGELVDRFKDLLKVYKDFQDAGKEGREQSAKDQAAALKAAISGNADQFKLSVDATGLDAAREKAAAELKLAEDKLALSRVDSALVTATGETAVRLAKDRALIIQQIYKDELAITEIQRASAISKATAKVVETFSTAGDTDRNATGIKSEYDALQTTVNALRADSDSLFQERLKLVNELAATRDKLESIVADKGLLGGVNQDGPQRLLLAAKVAEIEKKLASEDSKIQDKVAQGDTAENLLTDLKPDLEQATEAQNAAAKAQQDAAAALVNLRGMQAIERQSERDLRGVSEAQRGDQELDKSKGQTVAQLGGLLETVGDQGGKDLAPFVAEVSAMIADKALSADELVRLPVLLGQYFAKIANLGSAQNETVRAAMSRVDELERDIRNLKATAGKQNP
jgi:hypothetical protein